MEFDKAVEVSEVMYKPFISPNYFLVVCPGLKSVIYFVNMNRPPSNSTSVSDGWMLSFLAYLRAFTDIEPAFYEWVTKQELTERAFLEIVK